MNVAGRRSGAGCNGPPAPTATGTSDRPPACTTRNTLAVATSTETLPHTTVIATTSSAGSVSAHHNATASSTPPSVSMTTGRATRVGPQASRLDAETTGSCDDHGKLIHRSVCAQTYSGVMIERGL